MCGLFGISYGPNGAAGEMWSPNELMQLMFPAIVHRGPHAWGYMYQGSGEPDVDYYKQPGSATDPSALSEMDIPNTDVNWFAGHVRWATNGDPRINVNNHPVLHRNYIGMHNGKLRDWEDIIAITGRQDDTAEVDSEAIFAAVNKWGIKPGLKAIFGDMVSVFSDLREEHTLYLARTNGRPLWYGSTASGSLVWASEPKVIEETGLDIVGELTNWTKVNKVMTVTAGQIVDITEFRKPTPRRVHTSYSPREVNIPTSALSSGLFRRDKWGGTYIGANMWRIPGQHTTLMAEEYVEWAVEQELAHRASVIKDSRDRAAAKLPPLRPTFTSDSSSNDAERAALAIIDNNGNGVVA